MYTINQCFESKKAAEAWKIVNEVTGRKTLPSSKLKGTNEEDRCKQWKNHFKNLLGNPPVIQDHPIQNISQQLNIKCGHFSNDELDKALNNLKMNKKAGLDQIPPEVWLTRKFDDMLLHFCNSVYDQNQIEKWTQGCILPFPKKGDLSIPKNYRGITLTAIAAKIYNTMPTEQASP